MRSEEEGKRKRADNRRYWKEIRRKRRRKRGNRSHKEEDKKWREVSEERRDRGEGIKIRREEWNGRSA